MTQKGKERRGREEESGSGERREGKRKKELKSNVGE